MSYLDDLEQSVGLNMPNLPADVRKVKEWLRQAEDRAGKTYQQDKQAVAKRLHDVERRIEQTIAEEIKEFQRRVKGDPAPSGKVHPGDKTSKKLKHPHGEPVKTSAGGIPVHPRPGAPLNLPQRRGFAPLSDDDYKAAAKTLGCEARAIQAVALQEGKDHGFDSLNRPIILWEPSHFARYSGNAALYRKRYPDLAVLPKGPHAYGTESRQYRRLYEAYLIYPRAALRTPSWGKFQILGNNYKEAGYGSVESFVQDMCLSEQTQLVAFVHFILHQNLQQALHDKDWETFAKGYNGAATATRIISTPHGNTTYSKQIEEKYNNLKD